MKTNGNFIRDESIMAFAGLSVGMDEINSPKEEKQKAASIVASNIGMLMTNFPKNKELIRKIVVVIKDP